MKAIKDKRKFGWDKTSKNRNCKKFGKFILPKKKKVL